ncbi:MULTISPECIES: hypothetical protein [Microtetraspora]|uniref:Uncharacterized protein n=1 Tax=Microtetraspora glauca TaxID=1996 RepID=A0ABV3G7W2_MICGL|nr:hypothetical protein [Microtetraspora sp. AC03309]MCC5577974.1 hypothetical protein [Microtetraspora sp. AC03309]
MLRVVTSLDESLDMSFGKVRDIRSVLRRRQNRDTKIVDLRAYTGRNVIRFPKPGPTSAA